MSKPVFKRSKLQRLLVFGLLIFLIFLPSGLSALETEALIIKTAAGDQHTFFVEIAQTSKQREVGLMHRESMAPNAGMLFDFKPARPVSMWMRNTILPLDMIFILKDGTISGISENTVPYSLEIIQSPGPADAVLEINGGMSARLNIKAGDHIQHPMFTN